MLAITHYARLLTELRPDRVHVLLAGRIVTLGGPELADELEETGYEGIAAELGIDEPHVVRPWLVVGSVGSPWSLGRLRLGGACAAWSSASWASVRLAAASVVLVFVGAVVVVVGGGGGRVRADVPVAGLLRRADHVDRLALRARASGSTSAMCIGMRAQPCDAGYDGTDSSPCTAMPPLK